MQLGDFNGSNDSAPEDETLFTRRKRPKRPRPTCPLNLRDVLPESSGSSEEIEPSDTPPSFLRPTPTSFDFTHNTAFHSRRSNDALSSFTSPDIPRTNGDSSLFPSASSNSWLTSQNASGRIRQAGDKEQPPGTSAANDKKPPSSRAGGNSFPKLSSRSKETPESKDRKAALEKFRKKLQETDTAIGGDWATGSAWQTATDTPSPDDTNPPESSKPRITPTLLEPQPLKTVELQQTKLEPQITKALEPKPTKSLEPKTRNTVTLSGDPVIPRESQRRLRSNATNKPVKLKRPASQGTSAVPHPQREASKQKKTLCRFFAAFTQDDLLPGDFVDGVDISSDETKDNWSVEDGEDQLDSEWLELSHTDIHNVEDTEVLERPKTRTARVQRVSNYPMKNLKAMLPVYKALLCLGRLPFQIDKSEDIPRFKCNKKSWRYFLFVGTSALSFLTAILMMANFIKISKAVDPLTVHETATRLDRDKFWIEATLEVVSLLFLAISSVSMLEYGSGTSIVDFLNRWSSALALIRYDVTSGLRTMTIGFFCCYGIYAGTFVALFFVGGQRIPTVRGSCGFNGLLILNSFTDQLRLRSEFRVVEFLGLFVHLYTTFATSLVTLLICLHCWSLDNAAKRFNRRLAGCLRQIGLKNLQASQAYPKIFAEHLMVTSFPKQIGKAFRLALIAYLGCKLVELTVTLYGGAEPIVNGFPESDREFFNVSSQSHYDPNKVVPILVVEPSHIHSLKCGLYIAKTWIPWLIFMEIVQKPGSSLMRGAGLIVRNSLRHSKSSNPLRFITSMEFSFSSRIAFHVNPGIRLTREFTVKFVAFALVIIVTLLQFIPTAVNPQAVVICDHFGGCSLFHFPAKSKARDGFRDSIGKVVSVKSHATTRVPLPAPQLPLPTIFLPYPPSLSHGRLPIDPRNYAFQCQDQKYPVYIPTYFRRTIGGRYFQLPPTPEHSCVQSSSIPQGEALFDSFGDRVSVSVLEADECGNPKLPTPDANGAKKLPILRAVRLNREIFCCFVYSGLENQAKRCNLLSTATHSCSRKSGTPGREIHEKSIAQLWNVSSKASVESQLVQWTECLCQGLEGLPVSSTACTAPPTTTTPTTNTPTTKSSNKPVIPEMPCPDDKKGACGHCSPDPRSLFRKYFLASCPQDAGYSFAVPSFASFTNNQLVKAFISSCAKQTTVAKPPPRNRSLYYYDCYDNSIDVNRHHHVDDCGTRGVNYPSRYNGAKTKPQIQVERIPGDPYKFLCCWNYKEWQQGGGSRISICNTYPGSDLTKVCSIRTETTQRNAESECQIIFSSGSQKNQFYLDKCVTGKATDGTATCDNN